MKQPYIFAASWLATAILAACGGSGVPAPGSPANAAQPPSVSEAVLHSFSGETGDGANPFAGLLNVNGTLYGTTYFGGSNDAGTVYSVTASGKETVLHSFVGGSKDGREPLAGLVNVDGTLYSTTRFGGTNDYGVVFSIKPSGKERVLHSFYGSNGAEPAAGLVNVNGTLYGTTEFGGPYDYGTVFAITTSGNETVLHTFGASSDDGGHPLAGLVDVNGTLYGTTNGGGAHSYGTVFAITTSGNETVLYSFGDGSGDGTYPQAGLVNVNGTLYGTTNGGGKSNAGAVFAITTSGGETLLHSFGATQDDGADPDAGLLNVNGTLYGTTYYGGASGYGTVFAITPSGTETVLHSFGFHGRDGRNPYSALVSVKGTLYGTTYKGGAGYGTVFSVTP
jgi:uncharacterized repeat protein (TIGR03803 family)